MPESAREVLGYFVHNPQAVDNLEGIVRWRLMEETILKRVEEINQAVGWLVAHGFLLQESAAGLAPVFRLNQVRVVDAAQLVTEPASRLPGARRARGRMRHGRR